MQFETALLHSVPVDELTGAISVPIYQTSTFVQAAPGVNQGFDYARSNNPTRQVLENLIADLEQGEAGFAFASGLAAIDAVIKLLSAGDEVLAVDDIYGGTFRIFNKVFSRFGVKIRFVDTTDLAAVKAGLNEKTKLVWLETPTNPTLKVSDIEAIGKLAHANGSLLVVDNTFASPALQRPLSLGADLVIHSATKYLGGHSDLVAGLVVAKTRELAEQLKFIQNSSGAVLGPFDSWLCVRGIETLPLRIERQSLSAFRIAKFLEGREEVKTVYYPGLESHPNHQIARKQQTAFGGVVSFSLWEDSIEAAVRFVTSTKLFKLAESLGGVKSLLCHPAQMTHASTPDEVRRAAGVCDSLIRLSVGIEHPRDLIADLDQAFNAFEHQAEPISLNRKVAVLDHAGEVKTVVAASKKGASGSNGIPGTRSGEAIFEQQWGESNGNGHVNGNRDEGSRTNENDHLKGHDNLNNPLKDAGIAHSHLNENGHLKGHDNLNNPLKDAGIAHSHLNENDHLDGGGLLEGKRHNH